VILLRPANIKYPTKNKESLYFKRKIRKLKKEKRRKTGKSNTFGLFQK
jgi:hypothetical protein